MFPVAFEKQRAAYFLGIAASPGAGCEDELHLLGVIIFKPDTVYKWLKGRKPGRRFLKKLRIFLDRIALGRDSDISLP